MPKKNTQDSYRIIKKLLPETKSPTSENSEPQKRTHISILPRHTFKKLYQEYKNLSACKPDIHNKNIVLTKKVNACQKELTGLRAKLRQTTDPNAEMSLRGHIDSVTLKKQQYRTRIKKNRKLLKDLDACKDVIKANVKHHKTKPHTKKQSAPEREHARSPRP